jgi:hypothetical protein
MAAAAPVLFGVIGGRKRSAGPGGLERSSRPAGCWAKSWEKILSE